MTINPPKPALSIQTEFDLDEPQLKAANRFSTPLSENTFLTQRTDAFASIATAGGSEGYLDIVHTMPLENKA